MSSNINRKPVLLDEILPINRKYSNENNQEEKHETYNSQKSSNRPGNSGLSIKTSSIRINKIKDRIFILSPKVKSGDDRESNLEDFYMLEEPVKYGCLGILITSIHKVSKVKYALKIIKKEEIISEKNYVENWNIFIDNNYRLTNQNLIKFINHFEEENHLILIYAYMKLNLLEFIEKHFSNDDFYENLSMQYFIQVVGAVLFMNNNKRLNLDLRPENVMIDKQNLIKITDVKNKEIISKFFNNNNNNNINNKNSTGAANNLNNINNNNSITKEIPAVTLDYYTTPEELDSFAKSDVFELLGLDKSDKADVWRLGALLFHLVTGKAPYQANDSLGILSHVSTSTQQKKASFLKDLFAEKEICVLEISESANSNSNSNNKAEFGGSLGLCAAPQDLLTKSASIIAFAKEHRKKVECLVRLFMEKNLHKRPTIKEFKENHSLKSLLAKYKSSRASVELKENININYNINHKLLNSGLAGKSPLDCLKRLDSGEALKNIASPGSSALSGESREFEALHLEAKLRILLDENLHMKKENEKYKLDNTRLENENRIFQSEIDLLRSSYDKDRKSLEEEKKRMNTLNQDRISKINDLDEMTNEIIELKSKLRLLENDNDMVQFDLKEANETIAELQQKIDEMNANFESKKSEYETKIENTIKNLQRLQKFCMGEQNEISSFFKDDESMKKFAVMLYDLVKDFKESLDRFIISNFTDKAETLFNINQILNEKEDLIKNYIHKVKNDFMNDYLRISMKPIGASRADTSKEHLEWLKKRVAELTPFQIKSVNLENQNTKLLSENKIKLEMINLKQTEIELLKKLNQGLGENITANVEYVSVLESKLGYIKDFVFKNLPHCIEELNI